MPQHLLSIRYLPLRTVGRLRSVSCSHSWCYRSRCYWNLLLLLLCLLLKLSVELHVLQRIRRLRWDWLLLRLLLLLLLYPCLTTTNHGVNIRHVHHYLSTGLRCQ